MAQALNGNGEPPPSTLAAQIVQNLETAREHPRADAQAHLRELLQMILSGDASTGASQRAFDDTLEENYRLISVIAKACLEPLCSGSENPFEDQETQKSQARDSLAVIDLTIRRSPGVLFLVPPGRAQSAGPTGPLFLWLIPRLINLVSHEDVMILSWVCNVLHSAFWAQTRAAALKYGRQPVLRFIRGCIRDLLSYVKSRSASGQHVAMQTHRIPTAETLHEVHSTDYSLEATSSVDILDINKALLMVTRLCLILIDPSSSQASCKTCKISNAEFSWTIDCLSSVWSSLSLFVLSSSASSLILQVMLEVLAKSLRRLSGSKYEEVACLRITLVLCSVVLKAIETLSERKLVSLETAVCWSIADMLSAGTRLPTIAQCCYEHLNSKVEEIVTTSGTLEHFCKDLQRTLVIFLHLSSHDGAGLPPEILQFEDVKLRPIFDGYMKSLQAASLVHDTDAERPHKRTRNQNTAEKTQLATYNRATLDKQIYDIVEYPEEERHVDSLGVAIESFPQSEELEQCMLLEALGRAACESSHNLVFESQCPDCDVIMRQRNERTRMDNMLSNSLYEAMTKLLLLAQNGKAARPRIAGMQALRRLLVHSPNLENFDIRTTPLGQWCCTSLKSSIRDLRLAAIYTVRLFIEDGLGRSYLERNRPTVLEVLRGVTEKNDPSQQETCVLGFGQLISYVSNEEEINIALIRLLEYIGHTNPLVAGFAMEELRRVSGYDAVQAQQLFEPFWPSIAVVIVRNLQRRPQIAHSVCDLLGIHLSEFFKRTRFHTIPYLMLTRQRETLQKIAVASEEKGEKETVFSICISRAQLAAILSFLLTHSTGDVEDFVKDLLVYASPDFENYRLSDLLNSNAIYTAFEILKSAGENEQSTKERARKVLQYLADSTQRKPGSSRTSSGRKQDVLGSFFETWALAIVQPLSDIISQAKAHQPMSERKKCVGAIKEMALLAKSHLCHALPQICSCLRSAIEDQGLCNEALAAWLTLLQTLDEDYIKDLVDPTFAILAQHWDSFDDKSQQQAYDVLDMLFKNHNELVQKIIETIPSVASVPLLSKFTERIESIRLEMDPKRQLQLFSRRCKAENDTVVLRALNELELFLLSNQSFLQMTAVSEQPDPSLGQIIRSLLDACVRFKDKNSNISLLCARCLGLVGCVDPARVEAQREDPKIFVLSNFEAGHETVDFVVFFLREVLVKAYIATTATSQQQLLAFGMQELLTVCEFDTSVTFRRSPDDLYKTWIAMPESTRNILTPFLTSKYSINAPVTQPERSYPIYHKGIDWRQWLRYFTADLLQKGRGQNAELVFSICVRLIKNQDIAIASFLLPYVMLNVVVEGTDQQRKDILGELYKVLSQPLTSINNQDQEGLIICSQKVFNCLDYMSRWIQEKYKSMQRIRNHLELRADEIKVQEVATLVKRIPPKVISRRAVECKSFARALFYWEQYIREQETSHESENVNDLYDQLQEIYMQIDEPDGIEGISSCIQTLSTEQQVLEDRKAGRWMAVQNWYEVQLERDPENKDIQMQLLMSLRESGQHDLLLNQVSNFVSPEKTASVWKPFAVEASWTMANWTNMVKLCETTTSDESSNLKIGIGKALSSLQKHEYDDTRRSIKQLMLDSTRELSSTNTSSIQACHDTLLKFHVLVELEALSGVDSDGVDRSSLVSALEQRLDTVGAFSADKLFLLGVRRAAMQLSRDGPSIVDVSSTWLSSSKLARRSNFMHQASNAVLHASLLHDTSATIETARLTWIQGYHRRAIQSLKGAIDANAFQSEDPMILDGTHMRNQQDALKRHNMVAARAQLLLAKWMDRAGQTRSTTIIEHYRQVTIMHNRWEKGHYYLGKHYNKILESQKNSPMNKRSEAYLNGEITKLTIENLLRSLPWGCKYVYQTLPKVLTLWLDFGAESEKKINQSDINPALEPDKIYLQRKKIFGNVMNQMKKYIDRLPSFIFYIAFAQIVARICHPVNDVYNLLVAIVAKVVGSHPQQAIWPLLAMINSKVSNDRAQRGSYCKTRILEFAKKQSETRRVEIHNMLNQGHQVAKQLLQVCNRSFEGNNAPRGPLSLSKDMGFNHTKAAPCKLCIPIEAALLATLPPVTEPVKYHKAFSKDTITIDVFLDDFTVLNSLIRPRRIRIRGTDGKVYTILCKPKDDLRKDQRLLEFNSMISRTLKKDAECSKRRLYIKTYAVTPLNEEHGLIEWVEGMKTLREIFIESYKEKGIAIDYGAIRNQLNVVANDDSQIDIFTHDILSNFPPVLHEWFVSMFPEPSAWLAARLRYTRSCAVMSMVGHVLGLGDRHGENILLEEAQGGTFHVDFNCLFDKGKTFETPERVPFRLTHNMVDAFGVYRENGPFRKTCELTIKILRQYEDTLMTILETFLYDPTTDFIGKKRKHVNPEVPDSPEGVLEYVRRKVRGLPHGESVPLSEEGYVQMQIDQARDPWNLARMYIGWCAFF